VQITLKKEQSMSMGAASSAQLHANYPLENGDTLETKDTLENRDT